ncbi:LacI family DNA-binding transcriptional regulator [Occultella gossypii]|uniref:LacI family DNA-binding transcriptional regulator n=1 Tax=Occultella gossypii TaxID=2800820 RepID=A0ABS7S5J7_9MICO|nr:LacI family DNA-binding transcriptional regulator [Occultella gossypii]MBZ2195562.1 LacI family DNA-binding transcriptional regulator [Occultella gossypii]
MGRVTLNDVSARAGVSRATASLVVRGSERISPATTERVRAAMVELGYVYDRRAAMLRASRSMTIGVIVPEIRNPYLGEMIMAIEATLHGEGLTVLVGHSHDQSERESQLLSTMVERHVDGLLLQPAQDLTREQVDRYTKSTETPLVMMMRYIDEQDNYVGPDNEAAGLILGEHLRTLGARSVTLVGGPRKSSARQGRIAGLRAGLGTAVEFDSGEATALPTNYTDTGERAMAHVFDQGKVPDVVVGYSDVVTMGMYAEIYRRGLTPGRDVAVASFDDVPMASWLAPPLTSVATWPNRVGKAAAELLLARIADGAAPPERIEFEPALRLRASTLSWGRRSRG